MGLIVMETITANKTLRGCLGPRWWGTRAPGTVDLQGGGRFHCRASSSEWKMSVLTAETCCCRNSRLKTNDKTHTEES